MRTATMKKRNEEPRITCPVCGDTEKESSYEKDHGMCSRCWWFLSPEAGGKDHGLFMIRVRVKEEESGRRMAEIRPRGFWSGTIEVHEDIQHTYNGETKMVDKSWDFRVTWGCGGTDGTLDAIRTAENFVRAMDHAVMLAKIWKMERQERKEA
jgi:ribosomal protein L37E